MHLVTHSHSRTYEIVCVVSSEETFGERAWLAHCGVPTHAHSIRRFCGRRGASLYRDFDARAEYDRETVELLEPFAPDVVLLDGYLYVVTGPLLAGYPHRLLNLHFSDLTLRLPDGRPRFPGLRAVRDALAAGQPATYATVHLVNEELDSGAPLVQSWPFPASPLVRGRHARKGSGILKAYASAHQAWMMQATAGPLWAAALGLLDRGEVDLDAWAAANPAAVTPWMLEESGRVVAPFDRADLVRKTA